ncbi:Nup133 N terminal like-domain-containing protein [Radiomyces spectabilis]|uniref:Nup133 N terminal like-domain-containing protein n=1 Tax=Radiomyces spectabilis TaxID=64574 RepID=UPI00221E667C|nr:Nup133 N terminal like-domain-containing protein [Radiomyces spectabilis]KAI8394318.1 Nup133 N terminal like-domain-containing protein [Radiomyces spectabilis]
MQVIADTIDRVIQDLALQPDLLDTLQRQRYLQSHGSQAPLLKEKKVAFPDFVVQQIDSAGCQCKIGLFTEIGRVWLIYDHCLLLWDFIGGTDVYIHESLDQEIVDVGLAPLMGRPGDDRKYALITATSRHINVFELSLLHGKVVLAPRKLMHAETHGVHMSNIVGMEGGGIYMIGNDGHFYELAYDHARPSSSCHLICHTASSWLSYFSRWLTKAPEVPIVSLSWDDDRHILYTLNKQSDIELLRPTVRSGSHFRRIQFSNATLAAQKYFEESKLEYTQQDLEVISLHAISPEESKQIQLLAVTANGSRLYFSVNDDIIKLIYVQRPPKYSVAGKLHTCFYGDNVFLATESRDTHDTLFVICSENDATKQKLLESSASVEMDGTVCAVARSTKKPSFVVLTNYGVSFYGKQTPVSRLEQLFARFDLDAETYETYIADIIDFYGVAEVSAMSLSIICADYPLSEIVINKAVQVFVEQRELIDSTMILYYSRTISPMWRLKLFEQNTASNMNIILKRFSKLREFISSRPELQHIFRHHGASDNETDPGDIEKLYPLLQNTIGFLAFFILVVSVGTGAVESCIPATVKDDVLGMTIEKLLQDNEGKKLAEQLVLATIAAHAPSDAHNSIDTVSELLQNQCQTYFDPLELSLFQVIEILNKAHAIESNERKSVLQRALTILKDIADQLSFEQFQKYYSEFCEMNDLVAAIGFALESARKADPEELGLKYYEDSEPFNDSRARYYEDRSRYYETIFATLNDDFTTVLPIVLGTNDTLFHYLLYEWLIGNEKKAELLRLNTPYLIPFLQRHLPPIDSLDCLWRHHHNFGYNDQAALCLDELSRTDDVHLRQRIEYMSIALKEGLILDGQTSVMRRRKEVAHIQLHIMNALDTTDTLQKTAADELNTRLVATSDLLDNYARRFDIYKEGLILMSMVGRKDWPYVAKAWRGLIHNTLAEKTSTFSLLQSTLVELTKQLYPSENVFSTLLIVPILEEYCYQRADCPKDFAITTLQEAGISPLVLQDAYQNALRMKTGVGKTDHKYEAYLKSKEESLNTLLLA